MDIVTQGVLGAVLAQSIANKDEVKKASVIGFVSGLLADADIFITSSSDPLLNIEFHRHFTHSLFFIPFGAVIAALLLWPFFRNQLQPARLYIFSLLGYSMSGFLDACTSYGTHLLWPFSDERVSFNIISIVDPVFTVFLLIALIYTYQSRQQKAAKIGLILCAAYLGLATYQSDRAQAVADQLMLSRGHYGINKLVKPTLGNIVLWRSVYMYENRFYIDAIRVGGWNSTKVYEGSSIEKFNIDEDELDLESSSVMYSDIERFRKFSNNYIAMDKSRKNVIGDIRYSMLPNSIKPLWGIVIDKNNPGQHAEYRFFRDGNTQQRQEFLNMLLGKNNE